MTPEDRAENLWHGLNACFAIDRDATIATVTHWLECHGAGYPDVPLMQERIRDDARFWAASSQPFELEAYLAAAVMGLEKSPLAKKAVSRVGAWAFRSMDAETKHKFRNWAENER
jgi:hypothetical protein